MKKNFLILICSLSLMSCSHTYYVVRHAEKAAGSGTMNSDPPLSAIGETRAQQLKELLKDEKIKKIYSTRFIRTRKTAEPLRALKGLEIVEYGPAPDSLFIATLKSQRLNTLIVGHSNTVDDIVNGLTGENSVPGDLDESVYDQLYVITYKRFPFKNRKFQKRIF